MGSKSSTNITTTNNNDESTLNGLAAVRGDANTTQILDGGAIRESYAYAAKVGDNTSNNIGQVLNTIDSVAGKALTASSENSSKTIAALQNGLSQASGAIQTAYTKQQNGGIDPQMILIGVGFIALAFIFKG